MVLLGDGECGGAVNVATLRNGGVGGGGRVTDSGLGGVEIPNLGPFSSFTISPRCGNIRSGHTLYLGKHPRSHGGLGERRRSHFHFGLMKFSLVSKLWPRTTKRRV